jgi:hypothetical protein
MVEVAVEVLRRVRATRYVEPLREGGSLPGLVEADDLGTYVVTFTGAGQGRKALVSEVVVGELGRRLGIRVPEFQHTWPSIEAFSSRPYPLGEHALAPFAPSVPAAAEELAPLVSERLLTEVLELVPAEWLPAADHPAYVEYLAARADALTTWPPGAGQ